MDELIDILNEKGDFTGETAMKSVAHKKGLFHQTVHVWFYTEKGEVLIQQRGKNKDTHPLLWDVSVAGHIGAGEAIEISALREIEEEIGLMVEPKELQKIGTFKSIQKHHEELIDCEFHHTYICKLGTSLQNLKKQDSEVEALDLITLDDFKKSIAAESLERKLVPHETSYYTTIHSEIKKKL